MLSVVVAWIGVETIFYSATNYATIFYAQFISDQTHYFLELSMSTRKARTAFLQIENLFWFYLNLQNICPELSCNLKKNMDEMIWKELSTR